MTQLCFYFRKIMFSRLKNSDRGKTRSRRTKFEAIAASGQMCLCLPLPKVFQNMGEMKAIHFPGPILTLLICIACLVPQGGSHGLYYVRQCFQQSLRGTEASVLLQWKEERNPISCYWAVGTWPLHTCSRVCRISGSISQNYKWLHHFPRDLHLLIVMTSREKQSTFTLMRAKASSICSRETQVGRLI